jgi:hypothetical protein
MIGTDGLEWLRADAERHGWKEIAAIASAALRGDESAKARAYVEHLTSRGVLDYLEESEGCLSSLHPVLDSFGWPPPCCHSDQRITGTTVWCAQCGDVL